MCSTLKRPTHTCAHTAGSGTPGRCPGGDGLSPPGAESRAGRGAVRGAERCAPLRGAPSEYKDASAARAGLGDREKTYQPTRRKKKIKNLNWNLTLENEFDECLFLLPTSSGVPSSSNLMELIMVAFS